MIQVYKILNNRDKIDTEKFFLITSEHTTTRGNDLKFFKRRLKLNVRANTLSNRVVNIWNSLPNYVVLAPALNIFKSWLNNHWHGNPAKFQATYYIPGETEPTVRTRYRNGPLEAV